MSREHIYVPKHIVAALWQLFDSEDRFDVENPAVVDSDALAELRLWAETKLTREDIDDAVNESKERSDAGADDTDSNDIPHPLDYHRRSK